MAIERNIFTLGRRKGNEDQLTEMLAWLAEAVPEVAREVVAIGRGDHGDIDMAEVQVSTQCAIPGGQLDGLFETPDASIVLESKLGSSYGSGQLEKYIRWLATERADRNERILLTLTATNAPWPATAVELADQHGVRPAPHRWEELYARLSQLEDDGGSELAQDLLSQFMAMLNEEGLIPMKPLHPDEMTGAWERSRDTIARFHEYFTASKDTIGTALNAKPHPNRSSNAYGYAYHDFASDTGEFITIGIWCTDADWTTPKGTKPRGVPVLFAALHDPHWPDSEWPQTISLLERSVPAGWHPEPTRWYGNPCIWRSLDSVLDAAAFADQQTRLAQACQQVRGWVTAAWQTALAAPLQPGA